MMLMRKLTDTSWIFEQEHGEKVGVITLNPETGQYLLVSSDMKVPFSTIFELGDMLDEQITEVESNRPITKEFHEHNGFSIPSDDPVNIREQGEYTIYNEVEGGIDWVAGFWVHITAGVWKVRCAIKLAKLSEEDVLVSGPFKSKMEAQFLATKLNTEMTNG